MTGWITLPWPSVCWRATETSQKSWILSTTGASDAAPIWGWKYRSSPESHWDESKIRTKDGVMSRSYGNNKRHTGVRRIKLACTSEGFFLLPFLFGPDPQPIGRRRALPHLHFTVPHASHPWKRPHRHTQKCASPISWVSLNPIKLTRLTIVPWMNSDSGSVSP